MSKLIKISLVAGLVLSVTVAVSAMSHVKADAPDCSNPRSVLTANILSAGDQGGGALAIVTNNSDCSFNVGLDSYQNPNHQRFDSKGTVIGPREDVELHIDVPACNYIVELTTDLTVLDSRTIGSANCAAATPQSVPVSFHVHANCIGENIANATVSAGGKTGTTDGSGNVTLSVAASSTISWSASANAYNSASGTVASNNGASQDVTLTRQCAGAPAATAATTTATTAVAASTTTTATATAAPTVINNITNGPCANNASNSCNTVTNTSNITQNGSGNNAQVNQNGNTGSGYTGTQQNLYLPWMATAAIAPTPVPNALLSITKMVRNISTNTSEVKSVNANNSDTVEFVIRVSSSNNQAASNVRVTDSLPYGLTYITGSTTVDNSYVNDGVTSSGLNLGSFYAGRLVAIRFRATVGQGYNYNSYNNNYNNQYSTSYNTYSSYSTTLTNSATVYADNASPATDSATVMIASANAIINPSALTIQKTARNITRGDNVPLTSLTARAGDGIEFTITVTAPYNTSVNNVVIADALPAGMNYTTASTTLNGIRTNDGIVSGGINIGSLSSGQTATVVFYATVNPGVGAGQVLVNTASVRADTMNPITSNSVQITMGNYSIVSAALHVRTGPTGDAFALAGFGGLMSSAFYVVKRKGIRSLINLV